MIKEVYIKNQDRFGWGSCSLLDIERAIFLRKFLLGNRVVDIGCAGGQYVDYFKRAGFYIVGVDFVKEFLFSAINQKREGYFICAQVENLPFKDKSFDTALALNLLEHVSDDRDVFKEIIRITKKRIIIIVPLAEPDDFKGYGVLFEHRRDTTHLRYYSKDTLFGLFNNYNLSIICYEEFFPVDTTGLFISTLPFFLKKFFRAIIYLFQNIFKIKFKKYYTGAKVVLDIKNENCGI